MARTSMLLGVTLILLGCSLSSLFVPLARASLVIYLPFEGEDIFTGICPRPPEIPEKLSFQDESRISFEPNDARPFANLNDAIVIRNGDNGFEQGIELGSWQVNSAGNAFTIAGWFRVDSPPPNEGWVLITSRAQAGGTTRVAWELAVQSVGAREDGILVPVFELDVAPLKYGTTAEQQDAEIERLTIVGDASTEFEVGEWVHIAAVFDGLNLMFLIINGQESKATKASIQELIDATPGRDNFYGNNDTFLGARPEAGSIVTSVFMGCDKTVDSLGSGRGFNGAMDEIRIYDLSLAEAEIYVLVENSDNETYTVIDVMPGSVSEEGGPPSSTISQFTFFGVGNRPPFIQDPYEDPLLNIFAVDVLILNTTTYDQDNIGMPELVHQWQDTSLQACNFMTLEGTDTFDLTVTFQPSPQEDLELAFWAFDGELCTTEKVQLKVLPSEPEIEEGLVEDLMVRRAAPLPDFRWKVLTTLEVLEDGVLKNKTLFILVDDATARTQVLTIASPQNGTDSEDLLPTQGKRQDIDNTEFGTVNKTLICELSNSEGIVSSHNISVSFVSEIYVPPPDESSSSESNSTSSDSGIDDVPPDSDKEEADLLGAIVGGVVGGVLLLLIILLVVGIFVTWRIRSRVKKIKPYKPDFDTLAFGPLLNRNHGASKSQEDGLRKLDKLLQDTDYELARILCDNAKATEAETVAKALTYIYTSHNNTTDLLNYFVSKEVETSKKEATLFRANSISSKMFNCYARIVGIRFLWDIFAIPVTELDLLAKKQDEDFELEGTSLTTTLLGPVVMEPDPTKIEEASDNQINTIQLWLIAQKMLNSLISRANALPREVGEVLRHVNEEVEQKFSDSAAHKALGAFLFLRFICPSLMAPHVYGLLKNPPHGTCQRQLILIAKVLQNLANDTLPGKKEHYMERLNDFITSNQDPLRKFYRNVLDASASSEESGLVTVPATVSMNGLVALYCHINTNQEKILAAIQQEDEELAGALEEILDAVGEIDVYEKY
ncbi:Ras GTPase activating protein ira2 [Balamuthia mandrillaris]